MGRDGLSTAPASPRLRRTPPVARRLGSPLRFMALGRLHIEHKVNRRPQEMNSVGLDHKRVYRLQCSGGQFHVVDQHDNGYLWPRALDLIGDGCAIQES